MIINIEGLITLINENVVAVDRVYYHTNNKLKYYRIHCQNATRRFELYIWREFFGYKLSTNYNNSTSKKITASKKELAKLWETCENRSTGAINCSYMIDKLLEEHIAKEQKEM